MGKKQAARWFSGLVLVLSACLGVPLHAQDSARYEMTFQGLWTADDITDSSLPSSAHFTQVFGAKHNSNTRIWTSGGTASEGVESLAEFGSVGTLRSEINNNSNTDGIVAAGTSNIGPTQTVSTTFTVKTSHPLVSVLSMIAPTPDWFVGADSVLLYQNGAWRDRVPLDLYPYDAGTEQGVHWSLRGGNVDPHETITSIRNTGLFRDNPLARITFELQTPNTRAPDAPRTLTATASGRERIDLSWSPPSSNGGAAITGYRIEVSSNGGSTWRSLIANTSNADTAYAHRNLTPGSTRHYRIAAINSAGSGPFSNTASATTASNRAPDFTAANYERRVDENTPGDRAIGNPLAASDPDGDSLTYRLSGPDAASFRVTPSSGQLRTRSALNHEAKSNYQVTLSAEDVYGASASATVRILVNDLDEPPDRPGTPTLQSDSPTSLRLSWAAPENRGPAISSYDVEYRESGAALWTRQTRTGTGTTLSGLSPDTAYQVRVRATSDEGDGAWSNIANGRTDKLPDEDGDGVLDEDDAFPSDPNESADADGDGLGNNADTDDDNDGIADELDRFPLDPTRSRDSDSDGLVDERDPFPMDSARTTLNSYRFVDDTEGAHRGFASRVATAGDIDEDGRVDLLLSGPDTTYVVTSADLASADAADGLADRSISMRQLLDTGAAWSINALVSLTEVGDLSGDGRAEFALGHPSAGSRQRGAFTERGGEVVVFSGGADVLRQADARDGQRDGSIDIAHLSALDHKVRFPGSRDAQVGYQLDSAGDLDGDDLADLIVASHPHGTDRGAVYLFPGALWEGGNHWKLTSRHQAGRLEYVTARSDFDGEGTAALVILSHHNDTATAYILAWSDIVAADAVDGHADRSVEVEFAAGMPDSWTLEAEADELHSLQAGDFDGDGRLDLVVSGRTRTNAAHILNGADLTAADSADGNADRVISLASLAQLGTTRTQRFDGSGGIRFGGAFGEIDGDGLADLAFLRSGERDGKLVLGAALQDAMTSGDEWPVSLSFAWPYHDLVAMTFVDDLDGDGRHELLVSTHIDARVAEVHSSEDDSSVAPTAAAYLLSSIDLSVLDSADGSADGAVSLTEVSGDADEDGIDNHLETDDDNDAYPDYLDRFPDDGTEWADSDGDGVGDNADADDDNDGVTDLDETAPNDTGRSQAASYEFTAREMRSHSGLASTGDIDGDGREEILIAANGATNAVYLVASSDFDMADAADGQRDRQIDLGLASRQANSWKLMASNDAAGASFAAHALADINSDGVAEFLVAGHGSAYVISPLDLRRADAADGRLDGSLTLERLAVEGNSWRIAGAEGGEQVGDFAMPVGDAEGATEILISAIDQSEGNASPLTVYVLSLSGLAEIDAADGDTDGILRLAHIQGHDASWKLRGAIAAPADALLFAGGEHAPRGAVYSIVCRQCAPGVDTDAEPTGAAYWIAAGDLPSADRADGDTDGSVDLERLISESGSWKLLGTPDDELSIGVALPDLDGDSRADLMASTEHHTFFVSGGELASLDDDDDGVIRLHEASGDRAWRTARSESWLDWWRRFAVGDMDELAEIEGRARSEVAASYNLLHGAPLFEAHSKELVLATGAVIYQLSDRTLEQAEGAADVRFANLADLEQGWRLVPAAPRARYHQHLALVADARADAPPDLLIGNGDSVVLLARADYAAVDAVDGLADRIIDLSYVAGDSDGDGREDIIDTFPHDSLEWADSDGDGVGDAADDFPFDPNETLDSDSDGIGNNADGDDDNDGVADEEDADPLNPDVSALPVVTRIEFYQGPLAKAWAAHEGDLTSYLPLVAGRETVVAVHTAHQAREAPEVRVSVRAEGDEEDPEPLSAMTDEVNAAGAKRASSGWQTTALFRLPGTRLQNAIETFVSLGSDDAADPLRVVVSADSLPDFNISFIPIRTAEGSPDAIDAAAYMRNVYDFLPIADNYDASVGAVHEYQGQRWRVQEAALELLHEWNNQAREGELWHGIFEHPGDGSPCGYAFQGIGVGVSASLDPFNGCGGNTAQAQEIGHNFSLEQVAAGCGEVGNIDADYPYPDGGTGPRSGWWFSESRFVAPEDRRYDFMSSCDRVFVSDYHFRKAINYRQALGAILHGTDERPVMRLLSASGGAGGGGTLLGTSIAITGSIDHYGVWSLYRVGASHLAPRSAPADAPYTLTLSDSHQSVVHQQPMNVYPAGEGAEAAFSVRVPFAADARRLEVRDAFGIVRLDMPLDLTQ